jgi:hypothetical protein
VNEHVDEKIGALLEGRLDSHGRAELLAWLEKHDADREVWVDTAGVLREAEEDGSAEKEFADEREATRQTEVIPLRPRRATGWRSPAVRSLAAAAILAAIAVPVLRSRMNPRSWQNPERLYALSSTHGARLPANWVPAWGVTRGGGTEADETGTAARVGALHMDMVVSANAGDSTRVSDHARQAAATLENQTGGEFAAREYQDLADSTQWSSTEVLRRLAEARTTAVATLDPDYFALGVWTEAARLAAHRRDAAFFASRESRKALEQAAALEALDDTTKVAVTRLRSLQDQKTIQDWALVEGDLKALLADLAH